jgi:hypothetical protein
MSNLILFLVFSVPFLLLGVIVAAITTSLGPRTRA